MMVPTSTNREFHNSIKGAAVFAALFLFVCSVNSESLWESDFQGYVADGAALEVGDIILVTLNPHTKLSLNTTHVDSQQGKLSFTGGEGTSLFSFLPEGSSSLTKEIEEESSYTLETSIPARLVERDSKGLFSVDGSRTITINGKEEVLRFSGWCDPASVSTEGFVEFNKLYNAVLEYTSPGLKQSEILIQEDLQQTETDTDGTGPGPELTPGKQRELLLQYFNRFINTLFGPAD